MKQLTRVSKSISFALLLVILVMFPAKAQEQDELFLRLSRDFGYSSGTGKIQGTFSMRASGPENLSRVVFYLDDQTLGEVSEEPFRLRFNTDDYSPGVHTMYAVGHTSDGSELRSNEIRGEFVSAEEGWQAGMKIAIPILAITFGAIAISFLVTFLSTKRQGPVPLGAPRNYGAAGGAICPRCGRPFSRHILAPNMLVGKFERCPHCGKWGVVAARSLAELRAAEAAELEGAQETDQVSHLSEEEKLRKELEDTRFQDM